MAIIMNDAPSDGGRYGRYNGRWIRIVYPFKMTISARTNNFSAATQRIIIANSAPISMRIVGGHFVGADLIDTQTSVMNLAAGEHTLYVSNTTASTLFIYNPGAITKLDLGMTDSEYADANSFEKPFVFALSDLVDMTSLRVLNLGYCYNLTGALSDLSGMTGLTSLALSGNFTGALSDLSGMTGLTSLDLRNGNYTGALSDLSGMTGLTSLDLRSGNYTGALSLMNMQNLKSLVVNNCTQLTGGVDIRNMPNLTSLTLSGNTGLTGGLTLQNLPKITNLGTVVSGNMTGGITLSGLSSLANFSLNNNTKMAGSVSIANMPKMTVLSLRGCTALTGALSGIFVPTLTSLDLYNCISMTGALTNLSTMTQLKTLYLNGASTSSKTKFTGNASSMNSRTALTTFQYSNSAITGTWTKAA